MSIKVGIDTGKIVHTWEMVLAASNSLKVIIKSSLSTVLLLHRKSFAKPEFRIMKSIIIDLAVGIRDYLSYYKLTLFKLVRP